VPAVLGHALRIGDTPQHIAAAGYLIQELGLQE
jgi:hypothetical protein